MIISEVYDYIEQLHGNNIIPDNEYNVINMCLDNVFYFIIQCKFNFIEECDPITILDNIIKINSLKNQTPTLCKIIFNKLRLKEMEKDFK